MSALILPVAGAQAAPTLRAVELQSRPPEAAMAADDGALRLGEQPGASWLWLIDAGVIPEPEALERLLEAAASASPAPALLVSKVMTPDGALDPRSQPVPEVHETELVLAALERHTVALRVARRGSMLVRANGVPATGVDRDLEWTARLLHRERGLLVPGSVAVRTAPGGPPAPPRLSDALRLLAALEPNERLWFAAHLGEQALASRRRRSPR